MPINTAKMFGVSLTSDERAALESLGDHMEGVARKLSKDAVILDQGNNEVSIRDEIFSQAWNLKQIARFGTTSFGI